MGAPIVFAVVLFTVVAAGVPGRDLIRQTEKTQYDDVSIKQTTTEKTTDMGNFENHAKNYTLKPAVTNDFNPHMEDDVVTVSPNLITHELNKNNKNTHNGKYTVQDRNNIETSTKKGESLYNPSGRYEITENVIDIPDDRTEAGTVIYNYTKFTPLNLGGVRNETENKTPEPEEVEDDKTVRSRVSILHIKAEIDEKPVKPDSKIKNFFNGVKKYIDGFKTGVVNGISKLFRKHDAVVHEKSLDNPDDTSLEGDDDKSAEICDDSDEDFSELNKNDDDFGELHKNIHDDIHRYFN